MVVSDCYFWPVRRTQAEFNPRVPSIDVHFRIRRFKEDVVMRKERGVAIIPTAKLGIACLDVAEIRLRQLHRYVVIVEIPECVTIDRKHAVLVESSLKVQILDAAVNLIAWQPVFLFELRAIPARNDA